MVGQYLMMQAIYFATSNSHVYIMALPFLSPSPIIKNRNYMYVQEYPHSSNPYFIICGDLIGEKMLLSDISNWTNSSYIKLSEAIAKETKIYISINTLKRIFGKLSTDSSYRPQKATLDALAIFVGYREWDDFCQASVQEMDSSICHRINAPTDYAEKKRFFSNIRSILIILITFLSICFIFFLATKNPIQKTYKLMCLNPNGKNHHSAVFRIKKSEGEKDTSTLTFDSNDGDVRPVKLDNPTFVHYFGTPGWYRTTLNLRGVPVDTSIVIIKSDAWYAYVTSLDGKNIKHKLKNFNRNLEGMKTVNKRDLWAAGLDTLRPFQLTYLNIKKTGIDGDNLMMSAGLRIINDNINKDCPAVGINIFGDVENHEIRLSNPGYKTGSHIQFSEKNQTVISLPIGHKKLDSGITATIILHVLNRKVKLYVNNKLIYSTIYYKKIGKINGIRILFSGIGEVLTFSLHDLKSSECF